MIMNLLACRAAVARRRSLPRRSRRRRRIIHHGRTSPVPPRRRSRESHFHSPRRRRRLSRRSEAKTGPRNLRLLSRLWPVPGTLRLLSIASPASDLQPVRVFFPNRNSKFENDPNPPVSTSPVPPYSHENPKSVPVRRSQRRLSHRPGPQLRPRCLSSQRFTPRPMILVAVHIGVSLFVVGLVMRKSFLACPGCLATAWPLEEVYRWYRFRLLLRPNSLLTNTGDGEAGWGCASIDETTTGMPEKLLDAARATCVSECISTDAQFLLASRGSARSLVGRCWSNAGAGQVSKPGQTDPASNKRSDFGQFQSDSCVSRVSKPARASDFHSPRSPRVSFPTHPRHLNFTVEGLNFSGDAIKSRTGDDDSESVPVRTPARYETKLNQTTAGGTETPC